MHTNTALDDATGRLTALLTQAFGPRHEAIDDLALLVLTARGNAKAKPAAWKAIGDMRAITEQELLAIPNTGVNAGRRDRVRLIYPTPLFTHPGQHASIGPVVAKMVKKLGMRTLQWTHAAESLVDGTPLVVHPEVL